MPFDSVPRRGYHNGRMKNSSVIGLLAILAAALVYPASGANETFKVSELTFKRPSSWEWVESTSTMRAAQLLVPGGPGKDGVEVIFYYFGPGGGGGVQANVERWYGQFSDRKNEKSESTTVGKTKVTYVQAEGTYQSGMPGGPKTAKANYALLGAIIEAANGAIFVKATGPVALTKSSEAEFRKMVESGLK